MLKTLIVAHRGHTKFAPENSMVAFKIALDHGADGIELDVHFTKDRQLIVHHDYYLGRTENGNGFIGDYSVGELKKFDIGNARYKNEKMPLLREVLDIGKRKIHFEIELRSPSLNFLAQVIAEIENCGIVPDVELTSPHIPLLHHVKTLNAGIRTGVFFSSYPEWKDPKLGQQHIIDWMTLIDAQVVHLPLSLAEIPFIERLQTRGFMVHCSNLNNVNDMRSAIAMNIDQFSTDELDLAIKVRNALGKDKPVEVVPS